MSVSWQTVLLVVSAGAAAQIAAFLLNGLEPVRDFPGKNPLFSRMTAAFTSVPLLVTLLTNTDANDALTIVGQARTLCWILVGGVTLAVLYDAEQLWRLLRKAQIQEQREAAEKIAVGYAPQTRQKLLQEARRQVRQRLKYAYGDQALINLVMRSQQDKVSGTEIEGDVFLVPQPKQQLESLKDGRRLQLANSEETILETFDHEDVAGQLLILGAPGSGKTTTLLNLAESLLIRAEDSVEIPYIFELSTWQAKRQDIAGWLMAQLKFEHNIDEAVSRQWMLDGQLLPLLDGLDEVNAAHQQECVEKINAFVTGQLGRQTVVCCRDREYDQITRRSGVRLNALNGALRLQPLDVAQVHMYFEQMGRTDILLALQDAEGLGAVLQPREDGDEALLSIPLFLQILAIAYDSEKRITTKSALLNAYISRRLSETQRYQDRQRAKKKQIEIEWVYDSVAEEPDIEATTRYLKWLATQLNENSIPNVFLIERMQPSWLVTRRQKLEYGLIGGLIVGLTVGLIVGLIGGLIGGLQEPFKTRDKPNQGIIASAKNVPIVSIISYPAGIALYYLPRYLTGQEVTIAESFTVSIAIALNFGLGFGGGLAVIQHITLRWLLYRQGQIPRNYAKFLKYTTERRLTQQVGGSFRFIHRELLDHFEKMDVEPKRQSQ
ncbi:MAG: NACHT domain-containing protein [Cyanobacteria bacterium J06627_28]